MLCWCLFRAPFAVRPIHFFQDLLNMKYIALLLGLILASPAMAQNDTNSSDRSNKPTTQRAKDARAKAKKGQDPARQGQNSRGTNRRPGSGIDPGLLRRFDTNGDGQLSNGEKLAARRRIAQWRDRNRGNDDPRGGNRGDRGGRSRGDRAGRGSRGGRGNGPRPQPGAGGSGNGPRPQPGSRGSRGSRGNGPKPQPGAGGNGNGPRPQPGSRGSRGSRGNGGGPRPQPGRGNRGNGARNN